MYRVKNCMKIHGKIVKKCGALKNLDSKKALQKHLSGRQLLNEMIHGTNVKKVWQLYFDYESCRLGQI